MNFFDFFLQRFSDQSREAAQPQTPESFVAYVKQQLVESPLQTVSNDGKLLQFQGHQLSLQDEPSPPDTLEDCGIPVTGAANSASFRNLPDVGIPVRGARRGDRAEAGSGTAE